MTEAKKAPISAATLTEAVGQACGGTYPDHKSITRGVTRQGISDLLCEGEDNAMTAVELARALGCIPREVTRQIERERIMGVPICASGQGYFLPATVEELERYRRSFDRRLKHITATRRALEDTFLRVTGQTSIWGAD